MKKKKIKSGKGTFSLPFPVFSRFYKIFFFLVTAFIIWIYYSDILYKIQDLSLFLPSIDQLKLTDSKFTGGLDYLSRFLLQFAYYPLGGTFIFTLFLLLIQWLSEQILSPFKSRWGYMLSFLPSAIILIYCTRIGYDFYAKVDPTYPVKILLITILILMVPGLIFFFLRINRNNSLSQKILNKKELTQLSAAGCLLLLLVFVGVNKDQNLRLLTRIQRYTEQNKWPEILQESKKVSTPIRSIIAYRAIALVHTGRIGSELFDIRYEYPEVTIYTKDDRIIDESIIYVPEANYYSGLVNPAYHHAMQYMTNQGVSSYTLRLMAKCAIINEEWQLADKYLSILDNTLFYKSFAKKYKAYINNKELISKDSEMATVTELMSVSNLFEQRLLQPTFLGYYTALAAGKTKRSLELSLAACLYTKDMDAFLARVRGIAEDKNIPKHFQEAICLHSLTKAPGFEKNFNISPRIMQHTKELIRQGGIHGNDPDQGQSALYASFGSNYVYYYNYGNRTAPKRQAGQDDTQQKQGVN